MSFRFPQAVERLIESHRSTVYEAISGNAARLNADHTREIIKLKEEQALEINKLMVNHMAGMDMFIEEFEKKHSHQLNMLRSCSTRDNNQLILWTKIYMAKEAESKGVDTSFWDVSCWEKELAKLKEESDKNEG